MEATLLTLPCDIIRYLAEYGPDVARRLLLCCKRLYSVVKPVMYKLYGHLPITKKEVIAYAIHLFNSIRLEPSVLQREHHSLMVYTIDQPWKTIEFAKHSTNAIVIGNGRGISSATGWRSIRINTTVETNYKLPMNKICIERVEKKIVDTINGYSIQADTVYGLSPEYWMYKRRGFTTRDSTMLIIKRVLHLLDRTMKMHSIATDYTPREFISLAVAPNAKELIDNFTRGLDGRTVLNICFALILGLSSNEVGSWSLEDGMKVVGLHKDSSVLHANLYGLWAFIRNNLTMASKEVP
jgi:hypothetical protein